MEFVIYFQTKINKKCRKVKAKKLLKILNRLAERFDFRIYPDNSIFALQFFPSAYMYIELINGEIIGSAPIIYHGPGFHNFLCLFIDLLSKRLKLKFTVDDETGYYLNRDYSKLEEIYLLALERLLKSGIDNRGGCILAWPYPNWHPEPVSGFVIAPLGRWHQEELKVILEEGLLREFSRDFFLWPHLRKDEYFYRNLGTYLLWTEFSWTSPRLPEEENLVLKILESFQRAKLINPNINYPEAGIKEVKMILSEEKPIRSNFGFRKGNLIHLLANDWVLTLPGFFLPEREKDSLIFWGDDRSLRFTSSIDRRVLDEEGFEVVYRFDINDCSYQGKQYYFEAEKYYYLEGIIDSKTDQASLTITWKKEEDLKWALDSFLKIRKKQININY